MYLENSSHSIHIIPNKFKSFEFPRNLNWVTLNVKKKKLTRQILEQEVIGI